MARIRYDQYLLDADQLFTITNADTDYFTTTTPESFTNPPIKMRFLNTGDTSVEYLCLRAIDTNEIVIEDEEVLRMVRGELPGWRLVGAELTPEHGLSAWYANEQPLPLSEQPSGRKYSYHSAEGVSFHFLTGGGLLEVELEVDYADGLPARRYICKAFDEDEHHYAVGLIEYLGKRKIRKMQASEREYGDGPCNGHLCHITEY